MTELIKSKVPTPTKTPIKQATKLPPTISSATNIPQNTTTTTKTITITKPATTQTDISDESSTNKKNIISITTKTTSTQTECNQKRPLITVLDLVQGHQQVDFTKVSSFMRSPTGRVSKTPVKRSLSEPVMDVNSPGRKRLWSTDHHITDNVASPSKRIRHR